MKIAKAQEEHERQEQECRACDEPDEGALPARAVKSEGERKQHDRREGERAVEPQSA
jgi:hypothetical protein